MSARILIVDDDIFLSEGLVLLLKDQGYEVQAATTAADAWRHIEAQAPDLLLLDLGLPDQDGVTLCRRIRERWHFPILMLTSRSQAIDKVLGLESGADDYLPKPFDSHELVARVRAILRRSLSYPAANNSTRKRFGHIEVDETARAVYNDGQPVELTETEFKLLNYLSTNAGRAISREQLFANIWEYEMEFNSNSLEVMIYRLRTKIASADGWHPIKTMRGYGYKWEKD